MPLSENLLLSLNKDLESTNNYVNSGRIEQINIIGNRFLQNCFILQEECKEVVLGLMLKEIYLDLHLARELAVEKSGKKDSKHKTIPKEAKDAAKTFLIEIKKLLESDPVEPLKFLDIYTQFQNDIRPTHIFNEELHSQKDNLELSLNLTEKYLDFFIENQELTYDRNPNILLVTRGEIGTNSRYYGGEITNTVYLVLRSLELVYRFYLHAKLSDDELKNKLFEYFQNLNSIQESLKTRDIDEFKDQSLTFIVKALIEYRKLFAQFGEIGNILNEEFTFERKVKDKISDFLN